MYQYQRQSMMLLLTAQQLQHGQVLAVSTAARCPLCSGTSLRLLSAAVLWAAAEASGWQPSGSGPTADSAVGHCWLDAAQLGRIQAWWCHHLHMAAQSVVWPYFLAGLMQHSWEGTGHGGVINCIWKHSQSSVALHFSSSAITCEWAYDFQHVMRCDTV